MSNLVTCPSCSYMNRIGTARCAECGMPVDLTQCAQCEAVNDPAAVRCWRCDAPFPSRLPDQRAILAPADASRAPSIAPADASRAPSIALASPERAKARAFVRSRSSGRLADILGTYVGFAIVAALATALVALVIEGAERQQASLSHEMAMLSSGAADPASAPTAAGEPSAPLSTATTTGARSASPPLVDGSAKAISVRMATPARTANTHSAVSASRASKAGPKGVSAAPSRNKSVSVARAPQKKEAVSSTSGRSATTTAQSSPRGMGKIRVAQSNGTPSLHRDPGRRASISSGRAPVRVANAVRKVS